MEEQRNLGKDQESARVWEKWTSELKRISKSTSEEAELDEFIAEIAQLAERKAKEYGTTPDVKISIGEALHALFASLDQKSLAFLGVEDLLKWDDSSVQMKDAAKAILMCSVLKEELRGYDALSKLSGVSLDARRQNRTKLENSENLILRLYQELNNLFLVEKSPHLEIGVFEEDTALTSDTKDANEMSLPFVEAPLFIEDTPVRTSVFSEEKLTVPDAHLSLKDKLQPGANQRLINKSETKAIFHDTEDLPVSAEVLCNYMDNLQANGEDSRDLPTSLQNLPQVLRGSVERRGTQDWRDLQWSLIAMDDIPAAYWLSRALEKKHIETTLPSWLLAAIQASWWIKPDSHRFKPDLLEIAQSHVIDNQESLVMLGLAAAMNPVSLDPYCGLTDWLKVPTICEELRGLIAVIDRFAKIGITLHKEDISGLLDEDQIRITQERIVLRARSWIVEAPTRRTRFGRATEVLRRLVSGDGDLRKMALPVTENNSSKYEIVKGALRQWQNRSYATDQIERVSKRIFGDREPIVGDPRAQLLREVDEICEIVSQWCRTIEQQNVIKPRDNWVVEQITNFRTSLAKEIPVAYQALNQVVEVERPALACAGIIVQRAILRLKDTIQVDFQPSDLPYMNSWDWLIANTSNLNESISRRLLWFPELTLLDNCEPTEADITRLIEIIPRSNRRNIHSAFMGWLFKEDYRFIRTLNDWLKSDSRSQGLYEQHQTSYQNSVAKLTAIKLDLENSIEQAVVDGIIAEERSEFSAAVANLDPAEVLNFSAQYANVTDITRKLKDARQERLEKLTIEWADLKEKILANQNDARLESIELVESSLEQQDTRLVEEYIARLSKYDEATGNEFKTVSLTTRQPQNKLAAFLEASNKIWNWLEDTSSLERVANEIQAGHTRAGLRFGDIPGPRREEAYRAIISWRQFKQNQGLSDTSRIHIRSILQYIGFVFDIKILEPVQVNKHGKDWLLASVTMSASDQTRPIWQFGSYTKGQYSVLCLWERPGVDMISARINELRLNLKSVIILYLGRLTPKQYDELVKASSNQDSTSAILDEIMLMFLANERDTRLPSFLRCSLPFSSLNPYTPFQAGDVPPEMFFGRETMARELQLEQGSCIVYGGRQLGKSALLRHVEREFHNPEHEQFAKVIDIKMIGDPLAHQPLDTIWQKVRESFKEFGLISSRVTTDRPEEIEKYIRDALNQVRHRRVIILLDEADNFLNTDSKHNFKITEQFRILMADSQRRFKVVLAGLHNVQRFQAMPNQPLAHFGTPLCVGPLEPTAAMDLVLKPLEFLGFRFADVSGPLRIMSYTNYHPGLIQLFCDELLKRQRNRLSSRLPHLIYQNEIESVYRNIRDRIKERFDWTLALDSAYQLIAWSMIVDQMQIRDGYSRVYTLKDVLDLIRLNWKDGFNELGLSELEGLLDEMVGLGVLVKPNQGTYRLRSPNLVRLMGTESNIETQLIELIGKQPPLVPDVNHFHSMLDEIGSLYSPLNYDQERRLDQRRFDVGLVFASAVTGMDLIPAALKQFLNVRYDPASTFLCELPIWITEVQELRSQMDLILGKQQEKEHIWFYCRLDEVPKDNMLDLVSAGVDFCHAHQSSRRSVRLLFGFGPEASLNWHLLPGDLRSRSEENAGVVICPQKWNQIGIKQRLAQRDMIYSDHVVNAILTATNGWPALLDRLFSQPSTKDDPRRIAKVMMEQITQADSDIHQFFRQKLYMPLKPPASSILNLLLLEGDKPTPKELISPEILEISATQDECDSALQYLTRLGYVESTNDDVVLDPLVYKILKFASWQV